MSKSIAGLPRYENEDWRALTARVNPVTARKRQTG